MIPGVNIIHRKGSVEGIEGAVGALSPSAGKVGGRAP